ncbi:unnamed protein product [Scytosiphon promiscuus]
MMGARRWNSQPIIAFRHRLRRTRRGTQAKSRAACCPTRWSGTLSDSPPTQTAMTDSYIYHVAEEARWKGAGDEGYLPPGFEKDGFIHGTKEPHLVLPVANRFLSGVPGTLICLRIDPALLKAELKFEAARKLKLPAAQVRNEPTPSKDGTAGEPGGKEGQEPPSSPKQPLFPHIYGPLNKDAVIAELAVIRADDGQFLSIEGLS